MRVTVSPLDRMEVVFDDESVVANAGVGLVSQLAARVGLQELLAARLGVAAGAVGKAMTAVCAMALGADCIDDVDVLRAGGTRRVLGFHPYAPSTVGTWLRSFTWGHVRQLESAAGAALEAAWRAGAGPGKQLLFLDADSSVLEVFGDKDGAAFSYNGVWSLHPLFVTRGDTGEVVAARLRRGNAASASGAPALVVEAIQRARRGGARGAIVFRADSAFYDGNLIRRLVKHGVGYSISAPDNVLIRDYISYIPESAWTDIAYKGGQAQVAETPWRHPTFGRIIVRRVKNIDSRSGQRQLFVDWKMIAFVTNRKGDAVTLDREHRQRAAQETRAVRELKENALAHLPSKSFAANAAWLQLACLAHNLVRQIQLIGKLGGPVRNQATIRRRLLTVCGRITRSARKTILHLPAGWPWQRDFDRCHRRIRGVVLVT